MNLHAVNASDVRCASSSTDVRVERPYQFLACVLQCSAFVMCISLAHQATSCSAAAWESIKAS